MRSEPRTAGLLADADAYFAALTSYRDGDPAPIAAAFARAAFVATSNGRQLAGDIDAIRERWRNEIRARSDATAWKVANLLLGSPVVTASLIVEHAGVAPQNAYRALQPLLDAGVVVESTNRRRGRMWRAPEILDALDRFAARSGLRTTAERPSRDTLL